MQLWVSLVAGAMSLLLLPGEAQMVDQPACAMACNVYLDGMVSSTGDGDGYPQTPCASFPEFKNCLTAVCSGQDLLTMTDYLQQRFNCVVMASASPSLLVPLLTVIASLVTALLFK